MDNCLFCKIIKGEIPSHKVYEDDKTFAFLDINPINEGHLLVIPKNHSTDITVMDESDLNACIGVAKTLGKKMLDVLDIDGFNIGINTKPAAGQIIFHSHVHVIPRLEDDGFKHWHGKSYAEGKAELIAQKLRN